MKRYIAVMSMALALGASAAFAADTSTAKAGRYTVELATQPSPPAAGQNHITLTVKDGDRPVTGAGVSLHVDMVGMSMPSEVKAAPGEQDGQYVAVVNLGMEGQWKIAVDVQGMAGMAMGGDGKATFTLTAHTPPRRTGQTPTPGVPTQPPAPARLPWPVITGGVVALGIVVVLVVVRGRKRQIPTA